MLRSSCARPSASAASVFTVGTLASPAALASIADSRRDSSASRPPVEPSACCRSSSDCSRSWRFFVYRSTKTATLARSTHGSNGLAM